MHPPCPWGGQSQSIYAAGRKSYRVKALRQVVETTHAEHLLWAHSVLGVLLVTNSTKHQQ